MKETKLQQHELDIIQANNGLRLYLSGLLEKKAPTPQSSLYNIPGYKEWEPDAIKDRWLKILERLQSGTKPEREVFQFDSAQLQKWGPQGGHAPIGELLKDIVYPSFSSQPSPSAFSSDEWQRAKRATVRCLHSRGCRGLSPVPYHRVIDDMRARDTLESNSGWPAFTRRKNPEVVKQAIQDATDGNWKSYPAIALFRTYNGKTRLVWMFPMATNLVEGSYFQPLQKILMRRGRSDNFFAPWQGFDEVRREINVAYTSHPQLYLAASDFSATDAHFKLAATLEVFDVLKECFQPRFRDGLKESLTHMHMIPLIIGPDSQLQGEHGVSSGSNWTNFVETVFDLIFALYVEIKENNVPSHRLPSLFGPKYAGLYAIGDDMTWISTTYDEDFNVRLEAYGEEVGQEIKAEKTTNDPDKVKTLQRLFQVGYLDDSGHGIRAVYPTVRALKSLVYPERSHPKKLWSRDMSAVRTFMILENCVDHPLFREFCEFVADGDPYLREFARKPRHAQDSIFRESKLVPGLNPTYNQERRDASISAFASVQYLREH